MTLHLPTLLYACVAMLAVSAAGLTLYGLTQRVYRGFWWWAAAQWMLAAGLALQGLREVAPAVLPLSNLLLLQWPIVVLAGMRRFHSRHVLPLPAAADGLLLALAYAVWLASWAAHAGMAARVAAFGGGAMVLNLYGALLLMRLQTLAHSPALKALVATELFGAAVQAFRLVQGWRGASAGIDQAWLLLAGGLVVVLSALVMVCLALLLSTGRTEATLRSAHSRLRTLADIDTLTGVPNRRHFHELGAHAIASARTAHTTVMMFDIDHFKQVNDRLGHAAGDEALRLVARSLRDALRGPDVAGRLGGDEFAVVLPDTGVADAMAVAARVAQRSTSLSLSFGMVRLATGETLDDALRRADQALYEAKRQGRSRAVAASGAEGRPVFGESRPMGLRAA
jgi:diguanylate cyclase